MKLVELPNEVLQLIAIDVYETWDVRITAIRDLYQKKHKLPLKWRLRGTPPNILGLTCRALAAFHDTATKQSFSRHAMVVENIAPWEGDSVIGATSNSILHMVKKYPQWAWLLDAIISIKIAGVSPYRFEWNVAFDLSQLTNLRELTFCHGHRFCTRLNQIFYIDSIKTGLDEKLKCHQEFLLRELDFLLDCEGRIGWRELLNQAFARRVRIRVLRTVRHGGLPAILLSGNYAEITDKSQPYVLDSESLKAQEHTISATTDDNDIYRFDRRCTVADEYGSKYALPSSGEGPALVRHSSRHSV